MVTIDKARLDRIVERIRFGLPTESYEDLRYLAEVASGTEIPVRKRCRDCDGNGMISTVQGACDVLSDCPACAGTGFQNKCLQETGGES